MSEKGSILRKGWEYAKATPWGVGLRDVVKNWKSVKNSPNHGVLREEADAAAKEKLRSKKYHRLRTRKRAEARASDRELRRKTQEETRASIPRQMKGSELDDSVKSHTHKELAKRTALATADTAGNLVSMTVYNSGKIGLKKAIEKYKAAKK